MTTAIKLICPECRRENEAERIYCHDCGARLDRSAVAKAPPTEEPADDAHKRLKSMFDPSRARLRQNSIALCKILLGSACAAALIQICRPPDLPPAPPKSEISLPTQISMDLENTSMKHAQPPLTYSDEQVNSFLLYTLKNRKASLGKIMNFDRALMKFREGFFAVTTQRSISGFPFYATGQYRAALQNGRLTSDCQAGWLGRLPVHPKLMQFGGFLFSDLVTALDRERKLLAKMSALEFHPQQVVITPRT